LGRIRGGEPGNDRDEMMIGDAELAARIEVLKRERNAVILVHNYQRPEVQDIGDFVGDSLGLAQKAAETEADVIVFCGVHFMAETASILNPQRVVLLPDIEAGCPMADMVDPAGLKEELRRHPHAVVVAYVNTTAAVKAESDYCCTSANAVELVKAIPEEEVLFIPDGNLARYVASKVGDKKIIPWRGFCHVHQGIKAAHVKEALDYHPDAEVIAHPECTSEVIAIADHVRSTSGMVRAALESKAMEFIMATEAGMLYPLARAVPGKSFFAPANQPLCPNMKLITLSKVLRCLETLEPRVEVPEEVRVKALVAVERMLELGRPPVGAGRS
jgi:quinolinate synthase